MNPELVDTAAEATLADTLRDKIRLLEHRYKLQRAVAEEIIMALPVSDAVYGNEETAKEIVEGWSRWPHGRDTTVVGASWMT